MSQKFWRKWHKTVLPDPVRNFRLPTVEAALEVLRGMGGQRSREDEDHFYAAIQDDFLPAITGVDAWERIEDRWERGYGEAEASFPNRYLCAVFLNTDIGWSPSTHNTVMFYHSPLVMDAHGTHGRASAEATEQAAWRRYSHGMHTWRRDDWGRFAYPPESFTMFGTILRNRMASESGFRTLF
jgi:hypothetical protein